MSKLQTVTKVLQIKDRKKEDLKIEVKKAKDTVSREQTFLDTLEKDFENAAAGYVEKNDGSPIDVRELELYSDYFSQLHKTIDGQKSKVIEKSRELDEKQKDLFEAHREKKLLEVMQGKIVREDTRLRELTEQKEMDLMFLQKRSRE